MLEESDFEIDVNTTRRLHDNGYSLFEAKKYIVNRNLHNAIDKIESIDDIKLFLKELLKDI